MGLGMITDFVAMARTATMYQIKYPDLSWDSIPNSMTRLFEVNNGNVAACVPLLKPFARYVYAKPTGKDPQQIVQHPDFHV